MELLVDATDDVLVFISSSSLESHDFLPFVHFENKIGLCLAAFPIQFSSGLFFVM